MEFVPEEGTNLGALLPVGSQGNLLGRGKLPAGSPEGGTRQAPAHTVRPSPLFRDFTTTSEHASLPMCKAVFRVVFGDRV